MMLGQERDDSNSRKGDSAMAWKNKSAEAQKCEGRDCQDRDGAEVRGR